MRKELKHRGLGALLTGTQLLSHSQDWNSGSPAPEPMISTHRGPVSLDLMLCLSPLCLARVRSHLCSCQNDPCVLLPQGLYTRSSPSRARLPPSLNLAQACLCRPRPLPIIYSTRTPFSPSMWLSQYELLSLLVSSLMA
jgi:hypothetical protein